jgi:hypothetical protein
MDAVKDEDACQWEPGAWEEARAFGRAVAEHISKCCKDHKPPPFPPGVNLIVSDAEEPFSCPLCGMEFPQRTEGQNDQQGGARACSPDST